MTRNQRPQLGWLGCAAAGCAGAPGAAAGAGAGGVGRTGTVEAVGPGVATGSGGFVKPASDDSGSTASLPCGRSRVTGWANPALVICGLKGALTTSPVGWAGSTADNGVR